MKQILLLIIFSLIFTGFIMSHKNGDNFPSRAEQLVNSTLAKTSEIIQKKYKIKPCGAGAAMPGGPIQGLTLCFDAKYPYNKTELRELLIHVSKELLDQINANNEIHQFLKNKPFTIKNIKIIIYNKDKEGREVYDPEILTAEISQAILTYRTIESKDNFKLKNEFKESYEDALKIIEENSSSHK